MSDKKNSASENSMREIKIEKLTLNIGAGKDGTRLEKGIKLIKHLTGIEPVKTVTQKRIAGWGLRPGLPIGCKLTIRGDAKKELISKLLRAKENELKSSNFDNNGSVSFGIHEYIDIPGVEYNPEVGIMGLQVCITLERNGYRIKRRRVRYAAIKKSHLVTKDEAVAFMKNEFGIKLSE